MVWLGNGFKETNHDVSGGLVPLDILGLDHGRVPGTPELWLEPNDAVRLVRQTLLLFVFDVLRLRDGSLRRGAVVAERQQLACRAVAPRGPRLLLNLLQRHGARLGLVGPHVALGRVVVVVDRVVDSVVEDAVDDLSGDLAQARAPGRLFKIEKRKKKIA